MLQLLINDELAHAYPEGFRLIEPDELRHAFALQYLDMWDIHGEDLHTLISLDLDKGMTPWLSQC